MARKVLDRLGFALWLAGFMALTLGFLLRFALGGLVPAGRVSRSRQEPAPAPAGRPDWNRLAQT